MSNLPTPRKFHWSGLTILVMGFIITLVTSLFVKRVGEKEELHFLESEMKDVVTKIKSRFERYENALVQTRAFFISSENVSRADFEKYAAATEIVERYPGLLGLGFTMRVPPGDLERHLNEYRKIYPDYRIWPDHSREEYFSIVYLEPYEKNSKAIGFDMSTEPTRKEAMLTAIETGKASLSGIVRLVQDDAKAPQPGFLIYVPLFHNLETKRLKGFIYSPFRSYELFQAIFKDQDLDLDFQIYAGEEVDPAKKVFDLKSSTEETGKFRKTRKITLMGKPFLIDFQSLKSFHSRSRAIAPFAVALAGIIVTWLLWLIFSLSRKREEEAKVSEARLSAEAQRLKEKQVQLSEAIETRDDFLSIASHELKTPLTALRLQLQLSMRSSVKDTPPDREKLSKGLISALNQVDRLGRLVEDLLDVTRIQSGKLKYEFQEQNLSSLLLHSLDQHQEQLKAAGCTTVTQIQENVSYTCDAFRLQQVFSNLLMNAAKYSSGSEVVISLHKLADLVRISVKDHGPGIPPERQERIFERFERAGSHEGISGLGLGLYICREIVHAHGGEILVESVPGQGSEFIIHLPL